MPQPHNVCNGGSGALECHELDSFLIREWHLRTGNRLVTGGTECVVKLIIDVERWFIANVCFGVPMWNVNDGAHSWEFYVLNIYFCVVEKTIFGMRALVLRNVWPFV